MQKEVTKKEAFQKLSELNLTEQQMKGIATDYRRHKKPQVSLDQGYVFKDINENRKRRSCMFIYDAKEMSKWGVYKIIFDSDKFYIGRAKDINKRIHIHKKEIIKFFETNAYPDNHYFTKVFEYFKLNIMAYYFSVELLEQCFTVQELQLKEQKWLDKYKDSPNCLNLSFIAKKPENELDETPEEYQERMKNIVVTKRGGRFVFYSKKGKEPEVNRMLGSKKKEYGKSKNAKDFSFDLAEINSELGSTVFKLFCGDRYIIHKGKSLATGIFFLQKGYGYFIAYEHYKDLKLNPDYYKKFYDYIRRNPDKPFKVEIIKTSLDAYEVLVAEQLALNENIKDKKMFNNNLQAYVPKFNEKTGLYNWITVDQVNRFYSYLSTI